MKNKNEYMILKNDVSYSVAIPKDLYTAFIVQCDKDMATLPQKAKELLIGFVCSSVDDFIFNDTENNNKIFSIRIPLLLSNDFKTKCQALNVKPSKVMRSLLIDYIDKHQDNTKTTPTSEKDKKKLYYLSQATNYATSFRISRELYDDFQEKCKRYNLDYAKTVRHCMVDWLVQEEQEE